MSRTGFMAGEQTQGVRNAPGVGFGPFGGQVSMMADKIFTNSPEQPNGGLFACQSVRDGA